MQLIGLARLGRDVEVRTTGAGEAVANVSLAFNFGKKDDQGNRATQWADATLWGDRAGKLEPYLLKGTLILVTLDDPHIEAFTKRDGSAGSKLVGRIASLEFTGKGGDEKREASPLKADARTQATRSIADMEDDIPF